MGVQPITGRALRAQCQFSARVFLYWGVRYGAHHRFDGRNIALHCRYLIFELPVVRVPVEVKAAFPVSWSDILPNLI